MSDTPTGALHPANSGIADVLSGFETLKDRADATIMDVVRDLEALHRAHAEAIASRLVAHGEDADDGSLRGTLSEVMTTLRDWAGSLDADALLRAPGRGAVAGRLRCRARGLGGRRRAA